MLIRSAEFIKSSTDYREAPTSDSPEFAFIGRSNVGKSSLINSLVNRKGLAKISTKPGKTQTINHFLINGAWHLADLPGYGYAGVSRSSRKQWGRMIESYLLNRKQLWCTFILIDSRLEPQSSDITFINWLGGNRVPFAMVLTKADKITRPQLASSEQKWKQSLAEIWEELPTMFISSSKDKRGVPDILDFIEKALQETK